MWALDSKPQDEDASQTVVADEPEKEEAPPRIVCRRCATFLSEEKAVFSVTEGGAVQVFPNPSGWLRKIVTVRWAENLVPVSRPTTDFTWFAGYAWTIVTCAGCAAHLGWLYEDVANQSIASFYGLLVAEVERS